MKTTLPLLFASLYLAIAPAGAIETYRIDPVHSSASFKIKHLFAKVNGRFAEFSGTIAGDPAKPEETKVNVEIKTSSIDTGEPKRDEHLRSAEFFDADKFPTIRFDGKRVNRTAEDSAFVVGDLTMHGVTKEVILEVKFLGKGKGADGVMRTGWEARTALKRSDFGLTWSQAVEGTQVVSDDVQIELNIEAVEDRNAAPPATELTTTTPPATQPPQFAPPAITPPAAIPSSPTVSVPPVPLPTPLPDASAPAPGSAVPPAPSASPSLPLVFGNPEAITLTPSPAIPQVIPPLEAAPAVPAPAPAAPPANPLPPDAAAPAVPATGAPFAPIAPSLPVEPAAPAPATSAPSAPSSGAASPATPAAP